MKKNLLITIDFPPQKGGVANYLANFSEYLSNIIVLANEQPQAQSFDSHRKFKIIRANLYYQYFWPRWLKIYFIAKKIIAKDNIDQLIISHILPIGYVALLLKKPFVVILHGYDLLNTQKNIWKKFLAKLILSKAKYIIVNSQYTKTETLKLGNWEDKIRIVYPCPHITPAQMVEAEKQIIYNELDLYHKKILLSVGRVVERKGFDKVIMALPELIDKVPNLIYLIVGNGDYIKKLEALAEKLQIRGNVIFIANSNDRQLACYYALANIFIMPSRLEKKTDVEGFGTVYLEAALFGKPAIAGNSGGAGEAVINNQTGILVDPQNVQEIKEAVLNLLADPELSNKLGVQAKQRAEAEFQWPKQLNKIKDII